MNLIKVKFYIAILFILLVMVNSCKKDEAPYFKSVIKGKASFYDTLGYNTSGKGITVTALMNKDNKYTVTLDTSTSYLFENARTGTYTMIFEKEGYGTYKEFNIQHLGKDTTTIYPVELFSMLKEYKISIDSLSDGSYYKIAYFNLFDINDNQITYDLSTDCIIFCKKNNEKVSSTDYDFYIEGQCSFYEKLGGLIDIYLDSSNNYVEAGDKVFISVYLKNYGRDHYFDYSLQREVFPTMCESGSNVVSFIIE